MSNEDKFVAMNVLYEAMSMSHMPQEQRYVLIGSFEKAWGRQQPVQQPSAIGENTCKIDVYSSRGCELGTKSCVVEHTVPAAGVQGDKPKCEICQGNDGDMPCAYPSENMVKCLRRIRRTAEAFNAPPDSGRDAALDDAIEWLATDVSASKNSLFNACRARMGTNTVGQDQALRHALLYFATALAAHPANGAQAGDAPLLEQAAQACDQQAGGTNGPYRSGCLACASAVRELRDSLVAPQKKEG